MNLYINPSFYGNYKNKSIAIQDIISNNLDQTEQGWSFYTGQSVLPLTSRLKQSAPFCDHSFPYAGLICVSLNILIIINFK
jgi:hypothetical protein